MKASSGNRTRCRRSIDYERRKTCGAVMCMYPWPGGRAGAGGRDGYCSSVGNDYRKLGEEGESNWRSGDGREEEEEEDVRRRRRRRRMRMRKTEAKASLRPPRAPASNERGNTDGRGHFDASIALPRPILPFPGAINGHYSSHGNAHLTRRTRTDGRTGGRRTPAFPSLSN